MQFGRGAGVLLEQHAGDAHRDHGHRRPDPVAQRGIRPASRSRRVSNCVRNSFLWAIPASALAFALAWFIKEVPLRGRTVPGDAETTAPELVA